MNGEPEAPAPAPIEPPMSIADAFIRAGKTLLQTFGAGGGVFIGWHEARLAIGAAALSLAMNVLSAFEVRLKLPKGKRSL